MDNTKITFLAVAALLVGIAIGFNLSGTDGKRTDISLKFGESQLKIDLKEDGVDGPKVLEKIFSEPFSKNGALGWLKDSQNVFSLDDLELMEELKFSKGFYRFDDPELIEKFSVIGYDTPMAKALRKLRVDRDGPWEYQFRKVSIGIPTDKPAKNSINVCANGLLQGKTVELFRFDNYDQRVKFFATGKYGCPTGIKAPDVQLREEDARQLFGDQEFRAYDSLMVLIVDH